MRSIGIMFAGGIALAFATPTVASDRMGSKAIFAGKYVEAASHLEAERKLFPDSPELMLNLATAYGLAGRTSEARALYAQVLDHIAIDMVLQSGDVVSSHTIAQRGLARLSRTIASR